MTLLMMLLWWRLAACKKIDTKGLYEREISDFCTIFPANRFRLVLSIIHCNILVLDQLGSNICWSYMLHTYKCTVTNVKERENSVMKTIVLFPFFHTFANAPLPHAQNLLYRNIFMSFFIFVASFRPNLIYRPLILLSTLMAHKTRLSS